MSDLRNPYVILGVPYGASRDVATRAFARRAKGKRRARASDSATQLTDLTWALNQISDHIRDPRTVVDVYRIPADPGALEAPGAGVLRPPPEKLERTTASSEREWRRLLDAARAEAVSVLQTQVAAVAVLPPR